MAKFNPRNVLSSYGSIAALNANFNDISSLLERVVFRDGTSPNAMSADLDMNHFRLKNLGPPVDPGDPLRLQELLNLAPESALSALLASGTGSTMIGTPNGSVQDRIDSLEDVVGNSPIYNVADYVDTTADDVVQGGQLKAFFDMVPAGAYVVFKPGLYKTNQLITIDKQINIHGHGAQIWQYTNGIPVFRIQPTVPSNGNGDVRRMVWEQLDCLHVNTNGNAVEVRSPVGSHQLTFRNCYFKPDDTGNGYGLVVESSSFSENNHAFSEIFGVTLYGCTVTDGIWLNQCSDGFRSYGTAFNGKKCSKVEMAYGAFRCHWENDFAQARDGYLDISYASQLSIKGPQIEQPITHQSVDPAAPRYYVPTPEAPFAPFDINQNGFSIKIDASVVDTVEPIHVRDMGFISIEDVNFGGSQRVQQNLILAGSVNALSNVHIKPCTWEPPISGVDIVISDPKVYDTVIYPNQNLRGNRLDLRVGGVLISPGDPAYAALEAAYNQPYGGTGGDADDLLIVSDAGTGTIGRWRTISEIGTGKDATNGGAFMFRKTFDGKVELHGTVLLGATAQANDTTLFEFPPGLRPRTSVVLVGHNLFTGAPVPFQVNPEGFMTLLSGGTSYVSFSGQGWQARKTVYRPGP